MGNETLLGGGAEVKGEGPGQGVGAGHRADEHSEGPAKGSRGFTPSKALCKVPP